MGKRPIASYVTSEETRERLRELDLRYGLSNSDSIRRGVELLHAFLILDRLPDGRDVPESIKIELEEIKADVAEINTLIEQREAGEGKVANG
jgi:hypothetical protein